MPLFRYKALSIRGEVLDGQMDAASDGEVAARLQEQSHLPVEIRQASEGGLGVWLRHLYRARPLAAGRLVQFTQQLATLLGAGQPLDRSLGLLMDSPVDERSRQLIADIRDVVRSGASLSAALERQREVFSRLYVNMVRAGEAGGSLHETLQRLAEYLERSSALRGRVINALIYPVVLLVVIGCALLFLLGYVVPQFAQMYESLDVSLPWFTRGVLAAGMFVRDGGWLLLMLPLVVAVWFDRKYRDLAFRLRFDEWLLTRKLVGPLLAQMETAWLARTLGTLLTNGVALLPALSIARNVLGNHALAADVESAIDGVRNGRSLSAALGRGGHFPRLALQMIQVGEESGALDAMLLKAADTFEREAALVMDRLLAALTPAVTLLLASVVGVVIVAVLVPLYDLTSAMG